MKRTTIFNLVILGLALVLGGTACKKKPVGTTVIPGVNSPIGSKASDHLLDTTGGVIQPGPDIDSTGSIALPDHSAFEGPQNREVFAANTVHFDVDSAAVKGSESSNLEAVANHLKSNPVGNLLIEGHCDERGTEGYNLSLGDKRANALREYLVNLGVPAARMTTISFGEAKPVDSGHNESAWAKNRRGEFVLIEPAK